MNTYIQAQIRHHERERDRNNKIRCPHVAAKHQREIDKLTKQLNKYETNKQDR